MKNTWTNPLPATHPRIVNARQKGCLGMSTMLSWYKEARRNQKAGYNNVSAAWLMHDIETILIEDGDGHLLEGVK